MDQPTANVSVAMHLDMMNENALMLKELKASAVYFVVGAIKRMLFLHLGYGS